MTALAYLTSEYWSELGQEVTTGWLRRSRMSREQAALDKCVVKAMRLTKNFQLHRAHSRHDAFVWTLDCDAGENLASEGPRAYRAIMNEVRRAGHTNAITLASDPLRVEIARLEPQPLWLREHWREIERWPRDEFLFSPGMTPVVNGHRVRRLQLTDPRIAQLISAGGTGSGKTTLGMNTLLTLALTTSPAKLRMLVVDPKQVDMSNSDLQRLPHLMAPVVTDATDAVDAVMTVHAEMRRRMEAVKEANSAGRRWAVPDRIFLYVDELFHLVQEKKSIQEPLGWIAGEGRGVGVHLMLSTQRPTVDVVTGHIKSNLPCRIVGWVRSAEESKIATGLAENHAERINGNGHFVMVIRSEQEPLHSYALDIEKDVPQLVDKIRKRWGETRAQNLTADVDNFSPVDDTAGKSYNEDKQIVDAVIGLGGNVSLNKVSEIAREITGKGVGRERAREIIEQAKAAIGETGQGHDGQSDQD